MIIQQHKTSKFTSTDEYRKLPYLNYSSIKKFDENRNRFYREYVMKEVMEDESTDSKAFGDLVHCLLLTPELSDIRFAMVTAGGTPKPQMKSFVDNLWICTKRATSDGVVTSDMKTLMQEAFNMTAYDSMGERVAFKGKTVDYVIERFPSEGMIYYNTLRENFGKSVVSSRMYENAERMVTELRINPVTKDILAIKNSSRYKVYHEQVIEFVHDDHEMKAMCDLIIVDLEEKKVYLYDLKSTGWDVSRFEGNVVRNRYYLQWALYYIAVGKFMEQQGIKDCKIVPMQFIVVSTDTNENPLIYTTSEKDLAAGISGFTTSSGVKCKGLSQLLHEIRWHTTYGIWNMSYTDYHNNGVKKISLFEENS